jgi:hypothetical protein
MNKAVGARNILNVILINWKFIECKYFPIISVQNRQAKLNMKLPLKKLVKNKFFTLQRGICFRKAVE